MSKKPQSSKTEVLICGSGLAGLLHALELSRMGIKSIIASKATLEQSNSAMAQGGVAAVTGAEFYDSSKLHLKDTLAAGSGLTDEENAGAIIGGGALLIDTLEQLGVSFDKEKSGRHDLALEGGHSKPRVFHSKDTTGSAIMRVLINNVANDPNILILENTMVVQLIVNNNICSGAYLLIDGVGMYIYANNVVLATGGIGQIYDRTTNPVVATGDGIAAAYRSGARVIDMEFVQFHPTVLHKLGAPAFLISEAVRGAGAVLLDSYGKRFAHRFHPNAELGTRDVVARAIVTVMKEQKIPAVFLDMSMLGKDAEKRFPEIINTCRKFGIDPLKEPIPVTPAAHYFMGGICTDINGRSSISNLFALGECASIGLHGANRLASNSLLEAGVMALRSARYIANNPSCDIMRPDYFDETVIPVAVPSQIAEFKKDMYRLVGLQRNESELKQFFQMWQLEGHLTMPVSKTIVESANILLIGNLIAKAALNRCESRGSHFRSDYPNLDPTLTKRFWMTKDNYGWFQKVFAMKAPVALGA